MIEYIKVIIQLIVALQLLWKAAKILKRDKAILELINKMIDKTGLKRNEDEENAS